jgi:hypothetical protein
MRRNAADVLTRAHSRGVRGSLLGAAVHTPLITRLASSLAPRVQSLASTPKPATWSILRPGPGFNPSCFRDRCVGQTLSESFHLTTTLFPHSHSGSVAFVSIDTEPYNTTQFLLLRPVGYVWVKHEGSRARPPARRRPSSYVHERAPCLDRARRRTLRSTEISNSAAPDLPGTVLVCPTYPTAASLLFADRKTLAVFARRDPYFRRDARSCGQKEVMWACANRLAAESEASSSPACPGARYRVGMENEGGRQPQDSTPPRDPNPSITEKTSAAVINRRSVQIPTDKRVMRIRHTAEGGTWGVGYCGFGSAEANTLSASSGIALQDRRR